MPQNPDSQFRVIQSMAVVSPCSQCKAFSAEPGSGTLCPRRYWLDADKAAKENGLDSPPDYLLVSGTDDPEKLANPVYNKTNLSVQVWIALLENNEARNMDGELKSVDILSPGFDTLYIQCQSVPYAPAVTWAQQMATGMMHEWDQVLANTLHTCQTRLDLTKAIGRDLVQSGGFVQKLEFPMLSPLTVPRVDRLASGTEARR